MASLATRNTWDIVGTAVELLDPWRASDRAVASQRPDISAPRSPAPPAGAWRRPGAVAPASGRRRPRAPHWSVVTQRNQVW